MRSRRELLQFEKEEIKSPGVKAGGCAFCSYKGMVNCPALQQGRQSMQPLAGDRERVSPAMFSPIVN